MKLKELSTEQLLEQAKTAEETTEIEIVDDVLLFLKEFDIKPGSEKVKSTLLYKLYKKWSQKPLSAQKFYIELGLHFDKYRGCVYINYDSISLSQTTKDFYLKENPNKFKIENYTLKHILYFLNKYNIKKGNYLVDREAIWKSYREHCKGKKNALRKTKFFTYIDLCLKKQDKQYLVNGFLYNEEKKEKNKKSKS